MTALDVTEFAPQIREALERHDEMVVLIVEGER